LKRDKFIALNVGPCWPEHDGHEISTLYHSLSRYRPTLVYTTPDYGITYSQHMDTLQMLL